MASLTLDQQHRLLIARFPRVEPRYRALDGKRYLCVNLPLRPTESSAKYEARIAYALGDRPRVWILEPEPVKEAHGSKTPHLNSDGTLCLFDPATGEWDESQALVNTIVPWTLRWLFHYEHWLSFGDWRGDGPNEPEPTLAGEAPIAPAGLS